jgi:hypothetical protein
MPFEFAGGRAPVEPPYVVDGALLLPDCVPGIVCVFWPTGLDPTPA